MPTVHLMIGLPGSGKSTWIERFVQTSPQPQVVASTDAIFTQWGAADGLDYRASFHTFAFDAVQRAFSRRINDAIDARSNIVWDQTNLTRAARARKLARFPADYRRVGVWLDTPTHVVRQRLANVDRIASGKRIPDAVLEQMLAQFEPPDPGEFDLLLIRRSAA